VSPEKKEKMSCEQMQNYDKIGFTMKPSRNVGRTTTKRGRGEVEFYANLFHA
jgi:hypothetical protein